MSAEQINPDTSVGVNADFLIIGSGIAGLSYALKVAESGTVAIVTKKARAESNTNYAQGGIAAAVADDDSLEEHVRDTLTAGDGLCNETAVRAMFSAVRKDFGRLDALLNNAGIASMNHLLTTPLSSVMDVLRTNVLGTFLFCREAAKLMRARKYGRMLASSS